MSEGYYRDVRIRGRPESLDMIEQATKLVRRAQPLPLLLPLSYAIDYYF